MSQTWYVNSIHNDISIGDKRLNLFDNFVCVLFSMMAYFLDEVTFRTACSADYGLVMPLVEEVAAELQEHSANEGIKPVIAQDFHSALAAATSRVFIAEKAGKAIGFSRADVSNTYHVMRLHKELRCGYVDQVYVRPEYRNLGLGPQLLDRCEKWFREQGIIICFMHVAPLAMPLVKRLGYQTNSEMFKILT